MSDWTDEEFENLLGFSQETSADSELPRFQHEDYPVPASSIDWREVDDVTAVRDQGSCGACWAFAATAAIESQYSMTHNHANISLSNQELVDCTRGYPYGTTGCLGGGL